MKRLYIIIALAVMLSGTADSGGWTNPETGIMELFTGEIRLNEIYAVAGVIVGPGCTLVVDGDVNAGAVFMCRGGTVIITGRLTADVIYIDSAEAELKAEIGEIAAKYYTQCGGTVTVEGNIVAGVNGDYDGRGIININSVYSGNGTSRLAVGGGIFARGGDIRVGELPQGDEASTASFFTVRGITLAGYDFPASGANGTYVNANKGLNAMDGGMVYGSHDYI